MAKFPKKDYPVIFIGLGGTGKEMVRAIKRKFEENLQLEPETQKPRRTAYMVIDADSDNTAEFGQDYIDITVQNIEDYLVPNSRLRSNIENMWFNPDIPAENITYGAGGIRQVGRFQLFRNFDKIKQKFCALVNSISAAPGGHIDTKIDVVICAGLAGGTGSGTLIDTAYLASEWLENLLGGFEKKIYGFFTLPDFYLQGDALDPDKKANAYAALKELDYLQNVTSPATRMAHIQTYPDGSNINWRDNGDGGYRKPYDLVFLLSNKFQNGVTITGDAIKEVNNKVAEMMLSCYADEQTALNTALETDDRGNANVNNAVADFSFAAFMSNVAKGLLRINRSSTHPINYSFASLGFGSSNVVEEYIQQYETEAVLEEVLTVPLFDQQGNPAADGHKAVYKKDAQGNPQLMYTQEGDGVNPLLTLAEKRQDFVKAVFAPNAAEFKQEKMLDTEDAQFAEICRYTPPNQTFESLRYITAQSVNDHIDRSVGQEGAQGWRTHASTLATRIANNQWENFQTAVKNYIQQADIGPVALADYLEKIFVPQLDDLVQKWQSRSSDKNNVAESKANDMPQKVETGMYAGFFGGIGRTVGTPLLNAADRSKLVDRITKEWGAAGAAKRSSIYAEARYNSMRAFTQRVRNYMNNLITLNKALLSIQEEAGKKLDEAAATPNPHALVSADEIKDYFDKVAGRANAVAKAKVAILAQLAETSFALAAPPKNANFEELQQYNETVIGAIGQFITQVHGDMKIGSLDWIVDVNPTVANGQPNAKHLHVQKNIANVLDSMAVPMLPISNAGGAIDTVAYKFISVPYNAPILLQGFKNYLQGENGAAGVAVKASLATDRIVWLKIHAGIALKDILSMDQLKTDYENLAITARDAAGLHLNDSDGNVCFDSDTLLAPEQAGALLPGAFYNELQDPGNLSVREKRNWMYAKQKFREAEEAGLVTYNLQDETFVVDSLNQRIHATNFISMVNNQLAGEPDDVALALLENIASNYFGKTEAISYGKYLNSLVGNPPVAAAGQTAMDVFNANKMARRSELCAYLFMKRPNYLFELKQFGECVTYVQQKKQEIQQKIERERSISVLRLYLSGKISYLVGSFVLDNFGIRTTLFQVTPNDIQQLFGLAPNNVNTIFGRILQNYPLAVFNLLCHSKMANANANASNAWQQALSKYTGVLTDMSMNHQTEFNEYSLNFRAGYNQILQLAEDNVGNPIAQDADLQTHQEKEAVRNAYISMKNILDNDAPYLP